MSDCLRLLCNMPTTVRNEARFTYVSVHLFLKSNYIIDNSQRLLHLLLVWFTTKFSTYVFDLGRFANDLSFQTTDCIGCKQAIFHGYFGAPGLVHIKLSYLILKTNIYYVCFKKMFSDMGAQTQKQQTEKICRASHFFYAMFIS